MREACHPVIGSAAFVGWYNGHPDFADLHPPLDVTAVAIVGNGNVGGADGAPMRLVVGGTGGAGGTFASVPSPR